MKKSTILHSVAWSVIRTWGARLTSLIVFAVLSRLLDASDIGAVAFTSAIIVVLTAVAEMGLADYLIFKEDTPRARNQVFWFQVYVAVALLIVSALVGPPVLHHLGQHDAAAMFPYLCFMLPLTALTSVQDAVQRRALQFKVIAMRSLIGMLVGAVVGITLALSGAGMWSVVVKQLTENLIMALVMWRVSDWRPQWRCDWRGFRQVFDYSRFMVSGRLLEVVTQNVDDMIVGLAVGQQQLGLYSIGKKLYAISIELLAGVTQQISGPVFAKADGDRTRLWRMFVQALGYSAWIVIPLYVALYAFAPTIVPLLFGQHWTGAVWILQGFCLVGMLLPFYQFTWPLLMAGGDGAGKATSSFYYSLVRNVGGIVILLFAAPFGQHAFIGAQVARILFTVGTGWLFLRTVMTFHFDEIGRAILPAVVTAAAAGATFFLLTWLPGNVFIEQTAGVAIVLGVAYLLMLKKLKRI